MTNNIYVLVNRFIVITVKKTSSLLESKRLTLKDNNNISLYRQKHNLFLDGSWVILRRNTGHSKEEIDLRTITVLAEQNLFKVEKGNSNIEHKFSTALLKV